MKRFILLVVLTLIFGGPPPALAAPPPAAPDAKIGSQAAEETAAVAAEAELKGVASGLAAETPSAESAAAAAATAAAFEESIAAQRKADESAHTAHGLDARIRALVDSLALTLKRLPGDHRDQRFAVLPFAAVGDEATQRSLGLVVSDLVITDLARDHRLGLVERGQIGKLMDELALQQSGAVNDEQALQLGKVSGARALIIGSVADAGGEFIVSARAVDAETGKVLVASDMKVPKTELVAFSANAVVLRSRSGAMFRSVVVPGWGQSYNDQAVKGYIFGGVTGGLAAATIITTGLGLYSGFVEYPSAGQSGESAKLSSDERLIFVENVRLRANVEFTAAAVLAGLTATSWGLAAADAWLSGVDTESLDAALANN